MFIDNISFLSGSFQTSVVIFWLQYLNFVSSNSMSSKFNSMIVILREVINMYWYSQWAKNWVRPFTYVLFILLSNQAWDINYPSHLFSLFSKYEYSCVLDTVQDSIYVRWTRKSLHGYQEGSGEGKLVRSQSAKWIYYCNLWYVLWRKCKRVSWHRTRQGHNLESVVRECFLEEWRHERWNVASHMTSYKRVFLVEEIAHEKVTKWERTQMGQVTERRSVWQEP